MSELNPEFDESLLSAYVDGELTADQRAAVETRLTDDPQARQLVADLKAVSAKVRSLPRAKATEEVRAGVFQQLDGPSVPLQPSTLTMRKRLLWPLLATAALVMLMFYQPAGQENDVEIARVGKVQNQPKRAVSKNESAPQAASELKPMEEKPEADASGSPHFSPKSKVGLVHITLTDMSSGAKDFDRLLGSNGIQLVSEPDDSQAASDKVAAAFKDSGLIAESRSGGVGGAAMSSGAKPPSAEMILVEGPPEQIEKFLDACKQDAEAIKSIIVDESASQTYAVTPEQQGVISALNSLVQPSADPASAGLQQSQAWATKLRPNQSPNELKQLEEHIQSHQNQEPSAKQRNLAKRKADQPQQVRMLFLLHSSETSEQY